MTNPTPPTAEYLTTNHLANLIADVKLLRAALEFYTPCTCRTNYKGENVWCDKCSLLAATDRPEYKEEG